MSKPIDVYELAQNVVDKFTRENPLAHTALRIGFLEGVNEMKHAVEKALRDRQSIK